MFLNQDSIDVNVVGKHIDLIIKRISIEFESYKTLPNNQGNHYTINETSNFLNLPVNTYFIMTDSTDHIKELSFSIPIIENSLQLFREMSEVYGEPIGIYCMDSFIWGEESTNNGISTQEGRGQFNKCSFVDDPYLIRWKYNDLYIEYVKKEYSPKLNKISIYVSFTGVNLPRVR
ncbi:hypothetical protein [Aquimarina sp. MAR_2010_214]|uniref:hypothetical protein n=1 Tax=Aquimarina sp. MAR_2010_214 TaxID=1250026 RepID=UPI000C713977|nr:hypothetical protein [Aquimarina sp. MAR_2010_214]